MLFRSGYNFDGRETAEVLQDDGSYGSSSDYIFWFDVQGRYHQHLMTGGQIIHLCDEPLPIRKAIITFEGISQTQ